MSDINLLSGDEAYLSYTTKTLEVDPSMRPRVEVALGHSSSRVIIVSMRTSSKSED